MTDEIAINRVEADVPLTDDVSRKRCMQQTPWWKSPSMLEYEDQRCPAEAAVVQLPPLFSESAACSINPGIFEVTYLICLRTLVYLVIYDSG